MNIIDVARCYLGYEEEANGNTLFGKLFDYRSNSKSYSSAEWCMMFIEHCARIAGVSERDIPVTASCPFLLKYGKEHFRMYKEPKVGDICIFKLNAKDTASHVGIVTETDGENVRTIEGNRKHNNGLSRPWVADDRTFKYNDSIVVGYYRP